MNQSLQVPLRELLEDLDAIGAKHSEVSDSEVRESLHRIITYCVILGLTDRDIPEDLRMYGESASQALREVLRRFIPAMREAFSRAGVPIGDARLDWFQNSGVLTQAAYEYEYYFGLRDGPLGRDECELAWMSSDDHR